MKPEAYFPDILSTRQWSKSRRNQANLFSPERLVRETFERENPVPGVAILSAVEAGWLSEMLYGEFECQSRSRRSLLNGPLAGREIPHVSICEDAERLGL